MEIDLFEEQQLPSAFLTAINFGVSTDTEKVTHFLLSFLSQMEKDI